MTQKGHHIRKQNITAIKVQYYDLEAVEGLISHEGIQMAYIRSCNKMNPKPRKSQVEIEIYGTGMKPQHGIKS